MKNYEAPNIYIYKFDCSSNIITTSGPSGMIDKDNDIDDISWDLGI